MNGDGREASRAAGSGPAAPADPLPIRLINTVAWRGDPARRVDRLPDGAALAAWATREGLLSGQTRRRLSRAGLAADAADKAPDEAADAADNEAADQAADKARRLREALYRALSAHADGVAAPREALMVIHRAVADAIPHARPATSLPLRWDVEPASVADVPRALAIHAAEFLSSADLHRVRRCGDAACGWLFVDRTRNHTRRWCSSAGCGNRARARRHYASRSAGPAAADVR